ncbi:MAG TPA: CGNR zinc finger domain-containing protein [Bacteroidota bacterium]
MAHNTIRVVRGWKFSGGRISLDFVNSVGGRRKGAATRGSTVLDDRLTSYAVLADWAEAVGALTADAAKSLVQISRQKKRESRQVLDRALALRESLYGIVNDSADGRKPATTDVETLNTELTRAREREYLAFEGGKYLLALETMDTYLDSMLWPVAIDGADLLLSGDFSRIHQCPGPDCGWLFYDGSRNGSRQWCDMRTCGNLDKVRRYRARHRPKA